MSETETMRKIRLEASVLGHRLFRNNVGLFYTRYGVPIRCGLCTGSSDLIGWKTVKVTPEMVGKKLAVFLVVETKSIEGKPSEEQKKFLLAIKNAGGIDIVSRSVNEFTDKINT